MGSLVTGSSTCHRCVGESRHRQMLRKSTESDDNVHPRQARGAHTGVTHPTRRAYERAADSRHLDGLSGGMRETTMETAGVDSGGKWGQGRERVSAGLGGMMVEEGEMAASSANMHGGKPQEAREGAIGRWSHRVARRQHVPENRLGFGEDAATAEHWYRTWDFERLKKQDDEGERGKGKLATFRFELQICFNSLAGLFLAFWVSSFINHNFKLPPRLALAGGNGVQTRNVLYLR
ncbi:hypothetical protein DFH09DRAFT_1077378 [Mycena vulgaris]|nr:hypothetical protein DFH09DRAFT_1077378 [Mycena vulgaris]